MVNLEIITVLETDADVKQFLKEWKDEPKAKGKPPRRCGCGAELARWKHKCSKCIKEERQRQQQKQRLCQCGAVKGGGRRKCDACCLEAVNQHREYVKMYQREKRAKNGD
jgi:hypothetical protein